MSATSREDVVTHKIRPFIMSAHHQCRSGSPDRASKFKKTGVLVLQECDERGFADFFYITNVAGVKVALKMSLWQIDFMWNFENEMYKKRNDQLSSFMYLWDCSMVGSSSFE